MRRRTLVKLLVGLGIGIPVLVEGLTFLGLLRGSLLDGEGRESPTVVSPGGDGRVGVGDELLPGTTPSETVTEMVSVADGGGWTFVFTVDVTNDSDHPYEIRLGPVVTDGGETISGTVSTEQIPPGESGSVTGRWPLPDSAAPDRIVVLARSYPGTTPATVTEQVRLADVPFRGG